MRTVTIDTAAIVDRPSFHRRFQEAFGFPASYGANMGAWIDCLGHLDDPEAGMSEVIVREGEVLVLELAGALDFAYRCPDLWEDLIDGSTFVNLRRVDRGRPGILSLLLR